MKKPKLSIPQIWNMSFGFLGIQFGFALQNGNASRILQTFGADVHELSWFWLVAPLTGLIVQPIIGHYSDNTWTKMGRRKPFFLIGAVLASIGLIFMPNAGKLTAMIPALYVGAGMLMIMDASFNVAMEPFRALVGDKLPSEQRTSGFAAQTVLIGIGAVVGSFLPQILGYFGVPINAPEGQIPPNVIYSFVIGAIVLIATILWTVSTTTEYSPEEMAQFDESNEFETINKDVKRKSFLSSLVQDFNEMPKTMKQLGWVQFFSWFALFGMWVFATPAIAQHVYGLDLSDTHSETFNIAGNWVSSLFGIYNGVAALFAFALPVIASKIGRKMTHAISLLIGGFGLISIYFFSDPNLLIISMVGIGIAWASILSMPYAILAGSIPPAKMGVYMGIFNLFITIPQITNALIGGPMVKSIFGNQAIYALVLSGIMMIIGSLAVRLVDDVDETNVNTVTS